MRKLLLLLLSGILLLSACLPASAEDARLRGYVKDEGYIYVSFGRYPQTIDGGVPEEDSNAWKWGSNKLWDLTGVTVRTDPILWRILTVDGDRAYLCSEYVLFTRPMHPSMSEYRGFKGNFADTELCHYLNETFAADAFPDGELDMLIPFGDYGKISLLTREEMKNKDIGLGRAPRETSVEYNVKAWPTEYCARTMKAYVTKIKYGCHLVYWGRDQANSDERHAVADKDGGQIGHLHVDADDVGVRPVVNLDLTAMRIEGGSGTKTDPYVIVPGK